MNFERNILIEETVKSLFGGREYYELMEAKKAELDPVGEEDEDIDNDGDEDETDEYLLNRRKKIAKAIKEAKCEMCGQEDEDDDEEEQKKMKSKKTESEDDDEEDEEDEDLKESTFAQRSRLIKRVRRGEDIGKKGKMFQQIADKAARKYGSAERGRKVAAAAMWKNLGEETNYYIEMIGILEEAGYLDDEKDLLGLAEAAIIFFEGADEEYRNRLKRGQDYEQAQRAGAELRAKELKSGLGKGGLGHGAYGVASYENKDRQKAAQALRSIRDVRKEPTGMTARQRRIQQLSSKYKNQ